MRRVALLLAGALIWAAPARADFLEDLGFALGKLGDTVGEAIEDVTNPSGQKPDTPAATPTPTSQPPSPGPIRWNPAPPGIITRDMAMAATATPVLPRQRPANTQSGYQLGSTPASRAADDAPAPRKAPTRKPVQVVASLAPLPGFSEATALRTQSAYSPASAAAALSAPVAETVKLTTLPRTKPAVVLDRSFAVQFSSQSRTLSDRLVRERGAPDSATTQLLQTIVTQLGSAPDQRLKLESEAIAVDERLSEARRRSFERAELVKDWLVAAGVRVTQIDLDVQGAGNADRIRLTVYKAP